MDCFFCNKKASDGIPLSNGQLLHPSCLEAYERSLSMTSKRISNEEARLADLYKRLVAQQSVFSKLISLFRGQSDQIPDLERSINDSKKKSQEYQSERNKLQQKLAAAYDYYLSYPPDWEQRKEKVRFRDKTCSNCGKHKRLDVHHIISLANGGTNRIENLSLLCRQCHENKHGVSEFSGKLEEHETAFSKRVHLIQGAISGSLKIEFLYKKPTDSNYQKRIIDPKEIIRVHHQDGDNFTLCVAGYCYLRNEDRTFALKRMKALKLYK